MSPTPYRRLWWLLVALLARDVYADGIHCPCVPAEACSSPEGSHPLETSSTPCEDPKYVRCCDDSSSPAAHNEQLQMVKKDLEQEQKFVQAVENLMEKMQIAILEESHREEKSLDGTSKNGLGCVGKQCEVPSDSKDQFNPPPLDSLDTSNIATNSSEGINLQSVHKNLNHSEEASNKVIIVYAEKANNNTYETKSPQIVYPSLEGMEEYLQGEESSIMTHKVAMKDHEEETEDNDLEASRNQQISGRSNLRKLFPKRNSPLKSSQAQIKPDDQGAAESEIEEVKTTVPSPAQPEQTAIRKPFRPISRHTTFSTSTSDENTQTGSVSQSIRPRNKLNLHSSTQNDMTRSTIPQDPIPTIMDEINVKAINSMMKTSFTPRPTIPRRQRPMWHPQSRHQTSDAAANTPIGSPVEQRNLPQSTNTQTGQTTSLTDQSQGKTSESSQNVERGTSNTTVESQGSRYVTRRRNQFRTQNSNLQSKTSPTVSMRQEQAFDTLKESKPQEASRLRTAYRRQQVKAQSGVSNIDLAEKINSQSDPTYGKGRTKFRPHSRYSATPAKTSNEHADVRNTDTRNAPTQTPTSNNDNSPGRIQNTANVRAQTNPITPSEQLPPSDMEMEDDMEGSASEIQPQRVRAPGAFAPPQRVERGFRPMAGPGVLNVVGPVPAGFRDRARGFSNQELGFELPRSNVQPQFSEDEQFQFESEEPTEGPLRLLPPVFPVSQPPIDVSSTPPPALIESYSDEDLLPPLETPKPLSVTVIKPKATENLILDQHKDISKLNLEFNTLKTRYDMLLNRYAETLKIYNEKYRDLIGTTVEKKK